MDPDRAHRIHLISRLTIAAVWLYHGLVPKLLAQHPSELELARQTGVPEAWVRELVLTAGLAELVAAAAVLIFWRHRWPIWATMAAMIGALGHILIMAPAVTLAAFNPVSLNLLVFALGWVALESRASDAPRPEPEG